MRYALIGFAMLLSLAVVLLYAACIVGSEADDREERWFYGRFDK
jgi:hypothetical protein